MGNIDSALTSLLDLDGAVAVAVVDYNSGLALANRQNAPFDLELAAAVNSEVVKAKLRAIEQLGLNEKIEDILITLSSQYHLIRVAAEDSMHGVFTYLVLDKSRSNLALARRLLSSVDGDIRI